MAAAGSAAAALLFVGLVVGLMLTTPFAVADPAERVAAAREEARDLQGELAATRDRMFSAEEQVAETQDTEIRMDSILADREERTAELEARAGAAERAFASRSAQLQRAESVLARRLVAIYKTGLPDPVEIALDAGEMGDLAMRAHYMRAIEEADTALAQRVDEARQAVMESLSELRESRAAAAQYERAARTAAAEISDVRRRHEAQLAELDALSSERRSELETVSSKLGEWEAALERRKEIQERQSRTRQSDEESVEPGEQPAEPDEPAAEVDRWLGGPYSIPTEIVMCESGGNYSALNPSSGAGGAYQIIPSTWEAYGGEGLPHEGSKSEQDRIAALIWEDVGASAWVCAG